MRDTSNCNSIQEIIARHKIRPKFRKLDELLAKKLEVLFGVINKKAKKVNRKAVTMGFLASIVAKFGAQGAKGTQTQDELNKTNRDILET